MSTRAAIIVKTGDTEYTGINCHFDGYLEGVGKTLVDHYNNEQAARELVQLGNISSLYPKCAPRPNQEHSYEHPAKGVTVAYHRDRGEKWDINAPIVGAIPQAVAAKIENNGFVYIWHDGDWYIGNRLVREALTANAANDDADDVGYEAVRAWKCEAPQFDED